MAYWFAYSIYRLERFRVQADKFDGTLALILGVFSGATWLISTPVYLKKLGLSPIWMTALVVP